MVFVAFGLNHKTAPLAVREKIALPVTTSKPCELLRQIINLSNIDEIVILSTCNRTEFYLETHDPGILTKWLADYCAFSVETLAPYLYCYQDHEAIRHALRVAVGLDSMMLGEPQILGQMKQAYLRACEAGSVKTNLRYIFEYIFSASKRIRNGSGIGNNSISIAYAAVQLVGQFFNTYKTLQVLLIGAGETATLVAKYLYKQGVRKFYIASRTVENAQHIAAMFDGIALTIGDIPAYLVQADVVISATACPLPFISKSLVSHALKQRHDAPICFLDLAVPRDIEANVAELNYVKLYNIDDLQLLIDQGMHERRLASLEAEKLVEYELTNYIRWHRTLQAKNVICDYRRYTKTLAEQELERAQAKLSAGYNQTIVLEELCTRLVNKLSHRPTLGLKQAVEDGREDLLTLTHYLFNQKNDFIRYEKID